MAIPKHVHTIRWGILATVGAVIARQSSAFAEVYPRVGYQTTLSTLAHNVSGLVTIVDQDTFRIDDFTYDGGGIVVYAYLGEIEDRSAFRNGLQTGPQLRGTPFNGGTLIIDLPPVETLDPYNAISIWCVKAAANFGSGTFHPPTYPRAGYSTVLPLGGHSTSGIATIVDERTIRLNDFSYDGFAPAVYGYLGERNLYADFLGGVRMGPRITRAYNQETLTIALLPEQSLTGLGALSIWCAAVNVSFTSGAFPRAACDLDIDGDVDLDDARVFNPCLAGPNTPRPGGRICTDADQDHDTDVDLFDAARLLNDFRGSSIRAQPE